MFAGPGTSRTARRPSRPSASRGPRGTGEGRPGRGDVDRARRRQPQRGQWPGGGPVDEATLRLLASLLYRALRGARRRDGTRHALSVDGILQIDVAGVLPPRAARLEATTGTWTLADCRICVEWRDNVRIAERAAAEAAPATPPVGVFSAQEAAWRP